MVNKVPYTNGKIIPHDKKAGLPSRQEGNNRKGYRSQYNADSTELWVASKSTFKAMTDGQDYDENQGNNDAQNNQLHFHILPPHLPPYLLALLPEILCLQPKALPY